MSAPAEDNWDQALAELLAQGTDANALEPTSTTGAFPEEALPKEATSNGTPNQLEDLLNGVFPQTDEEPAVREAAVLVLGIANPPLLAAFLKGPQIAAKVLAQEGMGFAFLDDPTEEAALEAARAASDTLKGVQVLLMHQGPTMDPAGSDIQAYLYLNGKQREPVPPGLALAQSPQLLEDLLIDPEVADQALQQAVDVTALTPAEAIKIIARQTGPGKGFGLSKPSRRRKGPKS